jgi:hypothetical protein
VVIPDLHSLPCGEWITEEATKKGRSSDGAKLSVDRWDIATRGGMVSGGYEIEITCERKALNSVPEQGVNAHC